MTINLNWLTGNPTVPDLYFVAVELGDHLGMYELASWNGAQWKFSGQGTIIGFVRFTDFMAKLDLNWPKAGLPLPKVELGGKYEPVWAEVNFSDDELNQVDDDSQPASWAVTRQTPLPRQRNAHATLDSIKHKIACEVLATFSVAEVKARSKANIERWRSNGAGDAVYDEWCTIIDDLDDGKMIAAMVGLGDNSNRLRQSPPYVGMLPKSVVRKFNEEIKA